MRGVEIIKLQTQLCQCVQLLSLQRSAEHKLGVKPTTSVRPGVEAEGEKRGEEASSSPRCFSQTVPKSSSPAFGGKNRNITRAAAGSVIISNLHHLDGKGL